MDKIKVCIRCKGTEGSMIIHSKKLNGDPYYYCNRCNTERIRKYRSTKNGAERTRLAVKKSTQKHWHKQKAREKVRYAIKNGKLYKPTCCSKCNTKTNLEGHHEDYSKPLDVIWVCRPCHRELDKLQKQ